jgi:hypothetical protein
MKSVAPTLIDGVSSGFAAACAHAGDAHATPASSTSPAIGRVKK